MRTNIGIAAFCVVAAGAVGVSANIALLGSDTIKDTTVTLLTSGALDCGGLGNTPAGTLSYLGTGSGNGEAALTGNSQHVAPMSRRLGSVVCPATTAPSSKAEGIVFALDGISIVANKDTAGALTCAGAPQLAVDGSECGTDSPQAGFKFNANLACGLNITGANGWKDVLRLVYMGFRPSATTPAKTDQNCSDTCRAELVNSYAALFQGACAPGAGCTQLQHAFRRNDESGTTDVFVSSIGGAPGISLKDNYNPFCNNATTGPVMAPLVVPCSAAAIANDNICSRDGVTNANGACDLVAGRCSTVTCDTNADCTVTGSGTPAGATICDTTLHKCDLEYPVPGAGTALFSGQTLLPNHPTTIVGTAGNNIDSLKYWQIGVPSTQPPPTAITAIAGGVVDMQDGDPIRRTCAFAQQVNREQVCNLDQTLGVVLPIWDATETSTGIGTADAFPATACPAAFACSNALRIARINGVNKFALCPDGTDPSVKPNGSACPVNTCPTPNAGTPAAPNFACFNSRGNTGATKSRDGRVFNLTVWKNNAVGLYPRSTGQTASTVLGTTDLTPMYRGAYFRIHMNNVLTNATAGTLPCQKSSATDQIGCLVQASPCSIGYAGNSAVVGNTVGINVNNVAPSTPCVQNLLLGGIAYPISRKLYLNTVQGFETLSGGTADQQNEFKLAKCFAGQPGRAAGSAEDVAVGLGFIPLPSTGPGATIPFCDDVAADVCGTASACALNPSGIPISGYPNPSPGNGQN